MLAQRRGPGGLGPAVRAPVGPGPGRALFVSRPRSPAARAGPPFPPAGAPFPAAAGRGGGHAGLLDGALAVEHGPDINVFVGDGHYACEPMVKGLDARGLELVSKPRRDAALWGPWTAPPTGRPGRPRKYAGRFDHARISELPAVELPDEGKRLHHAQLYYKPFKKLLWVVFVLDADADPAAVVKPTTLFATDPEMDPERIYRIHVDRFQTSSTSAMPSSTWGWPPARPAPPRHHFHVNAVLAALAWTRLELRHAAARALDRFSMTNVKLRNFLEMMLARLVALVGPDRTLRKCPEAPRPRGPARPGPNRAPTHLNPGRIRDGFAAAARTSQPRSGPPGRPPLPVSISKTVHTIDSFQRTPKQSGSQFLCLA